MSSVPHDERLKSEIAHGRKIAEKAQKVWNWEGLIGRTRYERRVRYLATALKPGCGCWNLAAAQAYFLKVLRARVLQSPPWIFLRIFSPKPNPAI